MQALYNITFLLPASLLEKAIPYLPVTTRVGIRVDDTTNFSTENIYRTIFFKGLKCPICIAVLEKKFSQGLLSDAIVPLFNHPKYIVTEKKPEVILIIAQPSVVANRAAIDQFQLKAQAQGWAGLEIVHFFKSPYSKQKGPVFSLTIQSATAVESFFSTNPFTDISEMAGVHFIINIEDVHLIPIVHNRFFEIEKNLIDRNPNAYNVYMKLFYTTKKLQEAEAQLQLSNKQLDSLKRYNAILKSEEQTQRILEFYHSEYEVLPLWYKRFGHILKVLTGKRSLKSLFDGAKKRTP